MKRYCWMIAGALTLSACDKGEIPVQKPLSSAATIQVEMGADYGNQLFFSVENQEVVRINHRENWDIGFENGENGNHIILNSSKMMSCAKTTTGDLTQINSSAGLTFGFDEPNGDLQASAIGNWWDDSVVYVLDRGVTVTGVAIGKIKFKILEVTETAYTIQWAGLSSADVQTTSIPKNGTTNFTAFSFDGDGAIRDIEPPSIDWQLCFTTYTHLYDDGTPYLVTGVLSNRNGVQVAATSQTFESIEYTDAIATSFENYINVIGFDWKEYNFDLSTYIVDPMKVYLVKTQNERIFKLRFIDFYTESGVKGAPKFEITELIP